ncbi:FAD-binding oxidoreductase [Spirillospora sp. NPDC047279]|uniref:NAD(P)/FAD-dependent oxidoreductase n=1 Tax=Spirillospora sp. NPDC047279 TaxID=3155478 RepID=UPI00340138ED
MKSSIYWRDTEPVLPGPQLRHDVHCDVCIIGGGYTGLWAAYFLKQAQPDIDIHVLEADYAGAGASGHNDGFITPTIGHSLHNVVRRFGPERAGEAYAAVGQSIMDLSRFCRTHKVDAELERSGFYLVSRESQSARLRKNLDLAERVGSRALPRILLGADARDVIGSEMIDAALPSGGGLVNPHKLARGLARVVCEQGVVIHERTSASAMERSAAVYRVKTERATVHARKVLLATNAYQHMFRPFRSGLLPVWSYAFVTEPLSDRQLERVHWPGREGFVEDQNFILFGRLTADNRILFGGGRACYYYGRSMNGRHLANRRVQAELVHEFRQFFPMWDDVNIEYGYGGCIAVTRDFVPHVGVLPNGVCYAYGYCGNGIAAAHTVGKALRDLILDRTSEFTRLPFVNRKEKGFPGEPLAWAGARAYSLMLRAQDRYQK